MLRRIESTSAAALLTAMITSPACSGSDQSPSETPEPDPLAGCARMTAVLPDFPFEESALAKNGQAYLNDLATGYACSLAEGEAIDDAYFFYSYAPLESFNRIVAGDTKNLPEMRWVLHLSGHFGGIWLQSGLNPDGEDSGENGEDGAGGGSGGGSMLDPERLATEAMTAIDGSDADLFAYNKKSLLANIFPDLGMAHNFGYNTGYLLEIYESPPASLEPPSDFIECDGLLWCDYATPRLTALSTLAATSGKLSSDGARWEELREGVTTLQTGGESLGRSVWGGFMSKEGLTQDFYVQLLDVSGSFVEAVQATGLFAARGYAETDADAGRTSARMQSVLVYWLGSYMSAFGGGAGGDGQLPHVAPARD